MREVDPGMVRPNSCCRKNRDDNGLRPGLALAAYLVAATTIFGFSPEGLTAAPQVGRWTPAVPIQENKQFLGCAARFANADGLMLGYSLSNKLVWSLELSNEAWKFARGASFNVLLRIGELYLSQPAMAISGQTVRVQLKDSLQTFRVLSRVWEFDLMAGAVNSHFSLAFGDRVLTDLVRCVEKRDTSLRGMAGIDQNLAASPLHATDQVFDKEAETLNSHLMRQAGTTGAALAELTPVAVRLRPNSVIRVGANLLMVSVLPSAGFANVESLAHTVMARDLRACRGEIFAGLSFEKVRRKPAVRGYMNCRSLQAGISVHYVVISRSAGGYFLIATLFTGPELVDATEQAAAALDEQVWAAVSAMPAQ